MESKAEQIAKLESKYLRKRSHAWIDYLKACGPAQVIYSATIAKAKAEYDEVLKIINNEGETK